MTPEDIADWLSGRYDDFTRKEAWGERTWFVNPGRVLPSGVYFLTIKETDGPNDRASRLDREGVWRLNIGLPRPVFEARFGSPPTRPAKGCSIDWPDSLDAIDAPIPHPVYGWMSWIAVLSPSRATFEALIPEIDAAHGKAALGFERRAG